MLNALTYESNLTYTENGALTYRSSGSECIDFFAACGALRGADENEIIRRFLRAYAENPDTAMKILFYARDIRGGLGERRLFRCILRYLAYTKPESVRKNLPLIAEYGRFDDLLVLLGSHCEDELIRYLRVQLDADLAAMQSGDDCSLLAKWLPSVNTSSYKSRQTAKKLCRLLGMREKDYRQTLAKLRAYINIMETRLCKKDYSFDYEKLPSGALFKYRQAMLRNDTERYSKYLDAVHANAAKMNTGTLYPYQIVRSVVKDKYLTPDILSSLETTWNALTDYCDARNAIAVIDGSGSMYCDYGSGIMPITVALSLGIYFAEHSKGRFRNRFITFSEKPRLVKIKGSNIAEKVRYCMSFDEIANTDLFAVFRLILKAAVKNSIPQEELPELIYIISDMEFDIATHRAYDDTVHEQAKALYEKYGYKLPQVVYWNVCARNEQVPVTMNESGTALVSGANPILFRQMIQQDLTPFTMMEKILCSERYAPVSA